MAYSVVWTDNADRSMYQLTDFLAQRWPSQVVQEYIDKVYDCIDLLRNFPEIGRVTNKRRNIRTVVIRPYTRLYYQVKSDQVYLLRLVDTRQKPGRRNS